LGLLLRPAGRRALGQVGNRQGRELERLVGYRPIVESGTATIYLLARDSPSHEWRRHSVLTYIDDAVTPAHEKAANLGREWVAEDPAHHDFLVLLDSPARATAERRITGHEPSGNRQN